MTLKDQMPFGKHKGVPIGDLPKTYVSWLVDQEWMQDEKSRWKELYKLLTEGEAATASEEEIKQDNLEDELLLPMDDDFRSWWNKAYGRGLRSAKSPHLIPYLRISIAAWNASREVLTENKEENFHCNPDPPRPVEKQAPKTTTFESIDEDAPF